MSTLSVLIHYKGLLRAAQTTFAGDEIVFRQAVNRIRSEYRKHQDVSTTQRQALLDDSRANQEFLLNQVIQSEARFDSQKPPVFSVHLTKKHTDAVGGNQFKLEAPTRRKKQK
mmetsp:Transcript_20102/g.29887  ORF Transcript_20102/g.29887 Transcript_20102/m.29887 type:complete len:113 (-) Transcript_20102:56-394(-)